MIEFMKYPRVRPRARSGLLPYSVLPSRHWLFAAPVHVGSDLNAQILTLHTFQAADAYEVLRRDGVLVGDSSLGLADFQEAYAWMRVQVARRLPGLSEGILWLWPTATRRVLRDVAKHAPGDVLLTVRVARERALLSDFLDWHAVLNRALHVAPFPDESDDEWERRWSARADDFDARAAPYRRLPVSEWPAALRAEIEASWEAIFDPETWRAKPELQATVRELRAHDVVRAVRIR